MVGWSLLHEGEELLHQIDDPSAYLTDGAVFGLPLLHPWANRLEALDYKVDSRIVTLDPSSPRVELEENGLPTHGLLNGHPGWRVRAHRRSSLTSVLDFGRDPELLSYFPFPHGLELRASIDDDGLSIATTIVPRATAVPVAFGFHPYLCLPGEERRNWQLELHAGNRAVLDERLLPTGEWTHVRPLVEPLADRSFDDLYRSFGRSPEFAISAAGRRIALRLLGGFPYGQLWTECGQNTISFEPMTAPGNALRSGEGLRMARSPFTASFRLEVGPT